MSLIELAKKAEEAYIRAEGTEDRTHYVHWDWIKRREIFSEVVDPVIYVGCASELSSIFLFDKAKTFIHLDLDPPEVRTGLRILEKAGIVEKVRSVSTKPIKTTRFTFGERKIKIMEIAKDVGNVWQGEFGNDLGAIYFFGMPYSRAIREIQTNLLPCLRIGGIFEGAYPYFGGKFEGARPDQIGLVGERGTYVKEKQLSKKEIRRVHFKNDGLDTSFLD